VLKNPLIKNHNNIYWHYPHYHSGSGMLPAGAVRSGNYKLIEWYEPLLLKNKNPLELFDLSNDIGETHNLADSLPEKAKELQYLLQQWRNDIGAQMPTVNKNATSN
jgi:arylsulfatase A-like enzyme